MRKYKYCPIKWSLDNGIYLLSLSLINTIAYALMHFLVYSTAYYCGNNHLYEGQQHELSGSFDLFHVRTHNDPIPIEDNEFWKVHSEIFPILKNQWHLKWPAFEYPESLFSQKIILPFPVIIPPCSLHHASLIHKSHIPYLPSVLFILHNLNLKYVLSNYCSFTFWIFI